MTPPKGPLLSVLVPVYNMARYLPECMASLLQQTYPNLDIILVDDGSTDESGVLCDQYAQQDGRVRAVHQPNAGLSAARNTGLRLAQGEYLTHVDADDWLAPDCLHTLVRLCQKHGVPLATCNHWIVRSGSRKPCFDPRQPQQVLCTREAFANLLYHKPPDVSTWGKLYHRSLFDGIHYPEGLLYEDTRTIAPLLSRAQRLAFTPQPLYFYRIRSQSISRGAFSADKLQFLSAVAHMTQAIEQAEPALAAGAARRRMHAALSTRRYFIRAPRTLHSQRRQLDAFIRANAWPVLLDAHAPLRDKAGIVSACLGPWCYDRLWSLYEALRG